MLMGLVFWAVAGAVVGGLAFAFLSAGPANTFNTWSVAAALAGAATAVAGWHLVRGYASRA